MKKNLLLLLLLFFGIQQNLFAQQVTLATSKSTIAENESTTITATLDQASSRDVIVPITLSGTAGFDVDYTGSFPSKGEESLIATIPNNSYNFVQLSDGRYVFANGSSLLIYDPITQTETTQSLQNYVERIKAVGNVVYYKYMQSISKIDLSVSTPAEVAVVTNTVQSSQINAFDVVGSTVYYNVTNWATGFNINKIYSKTGDVAAVVVYEPSIGVSYLAVDSLGFIYITDSYSIQKIDTTNNNVVSNLPYVSNNSIKLFNNQLYIKTFESNVANIKKFNASTNTFKTLDYSTTNTGWIDDFSISADGNLQLSRYDTNSQNLLYNYQLAPQLKIPAGSTTGTITLTGIEDLSDESDETLILTPGTVTNATLSSDTPIALTITDNDELPSVSFALSASKIVENSATTVTFTATPSVISGKEITIPFTLSGTATPITEYTVSATQIVIPANASSASVTLSTNGLDDANVEIVETINFNLGTLVNATSATTLVALNLESDDNPILTSIVASTTIFAEHQSTIVTATLDQASSRDVIVPITLGGTAGIDVDYTGSFPSKGEESLIATIPINNTYNSYVQLSDGRYVFLYGNSLTIYDPITQTQTTQYLQNYIYQIKAVGNVVYCKYDQSISKIDLSQSTPAEVAVVTNTVQNSNISAFDVVGSTVYYNVNNWYTGHKIYSKTGDAAAVVVYEPTIGVSYLAVDSLGFIYITDTGSIQKIDTNNNVVSTLPYVYNNSIKLFNNQLYIKTFESNVTKIKKFNAETNAFDLLDYSTTNTESVYDFSISADGNLQLLRSVNNGQMLLYNYQLAPQLKIPAGSTTGTITLTGIEDDLNFVGQETDETIILNFNNPINSSFQTDLASTLELKILNNQVSLTVATDSPFMGVEDGAVSWGDFDRDGDQDVAIMGTGNSGAVTKLYENRMGVFVDTNQNFTRMYSGDISWVDINKDGWIDLVVSGLSGTIPVTKIYINDNGTSFSSSIDFGLPQLHTSKMAWGDLDNDGDIDLAITGIDANDNYVFNILYKEDNQNKFVIEPESVTTNYNAGIAPQGLINGDIKIVDLDLDGDNDIIYNGENSGGGLGSRIFNNSYIKSSTNNPYNYYGDASLNLKDSSIEVAKLNSNQNTLTILASGTDGNGTKQFYSSDSSLLYSGTMGDVATSFPKLNNGDITVADFNNDGTNDILFIGEDASGTPLTKLYSQDISGNFKLYPIVLEGLRNSTANWVDYDMDGDLDLFLTGIAASGGAKTLLYQSSIANKANAAPSIINGLIAEDKGNGKIKFQWTLPTDDYSSNLGYVIRIGKTPGGTELSNTESNLINGDRLITKQAPIYTNFYEMQLDPGKYYWSVQAVDTGLKGGAFSAEDSFTLTYDWKILNQGGIIDRSIAGIDAPIIKLADLDNDNDLDLIYANTTGSGSQILRFDGKKLISDNNSNVSSISYVSNISSIEIGDVNGDGITYIVRNSFDSKNTIWMHPVSGDLGSYINVGDGLYKSKIKIVDVNNDGQSEIVVLGMSSSTQSGLPKLLIFEYDKATKAFNKTDVSSQIAPLTNASFDMGDMDNDQDVDLIISGFNAYDGLKCIIYENVTELGGSLTLRATDTNLVAIKNGTTDFIDFDGDGDLDAIFTGTSISNDIFEIYINRLNEGITTWDRISSGLTPMRNSKIDIGDFNGDGFSDLLYSGITEGNGKVTKLSEYNIDTKQYVDSDFDVSDFTSAEVEFGDLDGDKDLDFVIVGINKNWDSNTNSNLDRYIFRTYINVRNDSAKVLASNITSKKTNRMFKNTNMVEYNINVAPSVPILPDNATKIMTNVATKAGTYPVEFSWNPSTDDHTPSLGLTYAIKIGTTPGGNEIMSSNSNLNGTRKTSTKGNAEHNTKWRLSLPEGQYYWSVQAIDASYSGSEFSASNKIEVNSNGLSTKSFNKDILVKVFPNPTRDVLTVTIPESLKLEKIEVYNTLGQLIDNYSANTISLKNQANGNYFFKIFTSGGIITKKIIKL